MSTNKIQDKIKIIELNINILEKSLDKNLEDIKIMKKLMFEYKEIHKLKEKYPEYFI